MGEETVQDKDISALWKRLSKTEGELHEIGTAVNAYGSRLASVETKMDNVIEGLKGLAQSNNKPTPWGIIFAGMTVLISVAAIIGALAVQPIKEDVAENREVDAAHLQHTMDNAFMMGKLTNDIEWIKKMESRVNGRIHKDNRATN